MRPSTLEEFVGQSHFLGHGKLLWRLLKADRLTSVIFYGPPGTGKTTLAKLLAVESRRRFKQINAVTSGVKELRELLQDSKDELVTNGRKTLLFVDEIHRFNRSQQDALLPDVENGVVTLVGATTSNPYFAINSALISRSQVFQFQPLDEMDIRELVLRACQDKQRGLGRYDIRMDDDAIAHICETSDGDARRALMTLEVGVLSAVQNTDDSVHYTRELAAESVQRKAQIYDANGDNHYDTASALIKSIRGSDPDAALYWLARMLEAGEDIRFICRRLVILASEDIGNADPQALSLAVSAMQACEFVGLPECQLTLSQAVCYLAVAPKSNAATVAISEARKDVQQDRLIPVPRHLRDSHYQGASELWHGDGYQYAHNAEDGIAEQDYLGVEREYYRKVDRGEEAKIKERLSVIRTRLRPTQSTENDGSAD